MSIGFVIGRAGSGKTHHCLQAIQQLLTDDPMGPPVYWIVPRQATFLTERLLLATAGPFSRCRILSFEKLGDEVLGTTGGAAITPITGRGRQMILGLLLRQNQSRLRFFASSARRVGLARELDRTFAEFERTGTEVSTIVETLETALALNPTDADTETLLAKASDLNILYTAYQQFIGEDRLDPHRRLQRVLELVAECPDFRGATVFIDAFNDFTRHERQMITGLASACQAVTVTMLIDPGSPVLTNFHLLPDELSLFHKVERNYRQVMIQLTEAGAKIRPIERLGSSIDAIRRTGGSPVSTGNHGRVARAADRESHSRFRCESLAAIEQFAFSREAITPQSQIEGVERCAAPDRASEVDAVARRIRDLTREGKRLRDITVLVRDLKQYQPLIATSFREHDLPFFVDARRPAMHHPLLQWLRSVFAIARRNWPVDDVIAMLKTGLGGLTLDQADEIENYVLLHGLTGEAWEQAEPWEMQRGSLFVGEDEEQIEQEIFEPAEIDNNRRAVLGKLRPFFDVVRHQPRLTFKQICAALFNLIGSFQVREELARWIAAANEANNFELAGEHEQTWTNLIELFDELVDLLGEHEVTLDDFVQTLEAGLEQFDYALAPATLDQIAVGEIERSRVTEAKIAIVLGLAEGQFPRVASEPTVLTDTDRGLLRRRSIELDDDTGRQLLDERLLGYLAFTRATEKLILTRPSTEDGGKPLNPSPFWQRLDLLFPSIGEMTKNAPCYAHDKPECIATPRQFVTGLMRWARQQTDSTPKLDPTWATLYNAIADGAASNSQSTSLRPSPGIPGEGRERVPSSSSSDSVEPKNASSKFENRSQREAEPSPQPSPGVPGEGARPSTGEAHPQHSATGGETLAGGRVSQSVITLIDQAWPALSYTNDAILSPAIAITLFPSPLNASVNRLETYAACPFKHFAQYGLNLQSRQIRDFSFADAGQAYHRIMETIVTDLLQTKSQWKDLTDEQAKDKIAATAEAVAKELRNEVLLSTARNRYLLSRIQKTLSAVIVSQRTLAERQTLRPVRTSVRFGYPGDKLQPPLIETPAGRQVRLHGRIDRIDKVPDRPLLTIVDYKSGSASLSMQDVYHGLAMQLLAYMLVLRENQAGQSKLTPIGAFYHRVTRSLRSEDHPADAPEPGSAEFHLQNKPRGIFHAEHVAEFDSQLQLGSSLAINVSINKDTTFGRRETSDVADQHEINQLLDHVKSKIATLADDLMAGKVTVEPYRLGNVTPCARCEFRSVCRFEVGINRYHALPTMKRSAVLEAISGGGIDA